MSLVKCKVCGKKIAHDAISCPGCGTNSPHKKKSGCLRLIVLIVLVGIAVIVLRDMGIIG